MHLLRLAPTDTVASPRLHTTTKGHQMRIRSTKPEFWRSERIASVNWDARLVLKGLESYVDDNGVGVDDIALIVTDVFPRDMLASPRETVARVSEAISPPLT